MGAQDLNSTDSKLTTNILSYFTNRILFTFHQTHFHLRDTVCVHHLLTVESRGSFSSQKRHRIMQNVLRQKKNISFLISDYFNWTGIGTPKQRISTQRVRVFRYAFKKGVVYKDIKKNYCTVIPDFVYGPIYDL